MVVSKLFRNVIEYNRETKFILIINNRYLSYFRPYEFVLWACQKDLKGKTLGANLHLKFCKWIHKKFPLKQKNIKSQQNKIFREACSQGHLGICKWLVKTFELTPKDVRDLDFSSLITSCIHGNLSVLKWICRNFALEEKYIKIYIPRAFRYACVTTCL